MKHTTALLSAAFVATIASASSLSAQAATVLVEPIRNVELQPRNYVTGTLRAVSRADVAARENAAVESIYVNEGDAVEAGAVLARLDSRRLQALLDEQKAIRVTTQSLIAQREAELERARLDFETKRNLEERDAISRSEFLDAQREFRVAETLLQSSRDALKEVDSRVEHLEVRLSDLTVRASFAGRVVERHVELGEWVNPGEPVVTLVTKGKIEAWLTVPERYAADVATYAERLNVDVPSLHTVARSQRVTVVPEVHPRARTFNVVVELDDQDGRLSPGMSVTAWIPTGARADHLAVESDSVIRSRDSSYVYVASEGADGHTAVRTEVHVLFSEGNWLAIEGENVEAGQLVVVEGNERLLPGQPVLVEMAPQDEPQMQVATVDVARSDAL